MRWRWLRSPRWRLGLVIAAVGLTAAVILFRAAQTHPIDSYAACVDAGYPISLSEPPVCRTGQNSFVGPPGQPTSTPPPATSVPFNLLVEGDSHGDYPRRQEVISTQAEWEGYWRAVHSGLGSLPPLIPVDFTSSTVVALSTGPHATGGYGLHVTNIMKSEAGTVVGVVESVPTITCTVTQAQTNRYIIVRVPERLPEPISFRLATTKHRC